MKNPEGLSDATILALVVEGAAGVIMDNPGIAPERVVELARDERIHKAAEQIALETLALLALRKRPITNEMRILAGYWALKKSSKQRGRPDDRATAIAVWSACVDIVNKEPNRPRESVVAEIQARFKISRGQIFKILKKLREQDPDMALP